jgi:hypothetical protein
MPSEAHPSVTQRVFGIGLYYGDAMIRFRVGLLNVWWC